MWEKFGDSEWNIPEARSTVAQLRHHAGDGREYDGIELFLALCEYLDRLHGELGFDYFRTGADQAALAASVQEVRGPKIEPDPDTDRLVQPVNAAVTLVEGRELADLAGGTARLGATGRPVPARDVCLSRPVVRRTGNVQPAAQACRAGAGRGAVTAWPPGTNGTSLPLRYAGESLVLHA